MIAATIALALIQAVSGGPRPDRPLPLSAAAPASREPGSNLTVYLLTMGPGDQVWERFGHNAIWIHDDLTSSDIVYHWGLFDFADENFLPNFIRGRMRYSMGAFDMEQTVDAYRQANRTVWAQELELTPAQRLKLADFVAWNVLPANRHYDYDYYLDNCSTRVRDALDLALGGVIRTASQGVGTGTTYRFHTARLTQDDLPIYTGTMIGLGQPVDRPISAWEEMFLPVRMMEQLKGMRVTRPEGLLPLVKSERVLVHATRSPEPVTVDSRILIFLAVAGALLVIGAALILLRTPGRGGGGALALATLWSMVAGIAGSLIAFLWGFTDHIYSYRNENLFQLNPISLVLAGFLVRTMWKRRRGNDAGESARRDALRIALVVAAVAVIGFVVQALPVFNQGNAEVIALALPLHLGVAGLLVALRSAPSRFPAA